MAALDKTGTVMAPARSFFFTISQWVILFFLTALCIFFLDLLGIPASLLVGPMFAGILFSLGGGRVFLPKICFPTAQAIIGCFLASSVSASFFASLAGHWLLFLFIVLSTLLLSTVMGWVATRMNLFPGTTAIWGISPGAASAMVIMAATDGADFRLVAFMQYLRVVIVALVASFVAHYFIDIPPEATVIKEWFPAIDATAFGSMILVGCIGGLFGKFFKFPSSMLMCPLILGAVLQGSGLIAMQVPLWLQAISYTFLGWHIGLGFNRDILAHAFSSLPQIVGSILILVAFGGLMAFLLVCTVDVDPLTAYLATSPGGMESIAIIAASTDVDVLFVMTLQTLRLLIVVILGPKISHFVAMRVRQ